MALWVLRDERVTSALIGASRPEQILENAKASQAHFTHEELTKLDAILTQANLPPSLWARVRGATCRNVATVAESQQLITPYWAEVWKQAQRNLATKLVALKVVGVYRCR